MKLQKIMAAGQSLLGIVNSATTFKPSRAPAIPLAVKSPYMNTWLEVGSGGNGELAGNWPAPQPGDVAGTTGSVTGWAGLIKVDGTVYTWMGAPAVDGNFPQNVVQNSVEYTSQSSIFTSTAGKVNLKVTFTSPVTPTDFQRQSIIGTYLNVEVSSNDGATHNVQIYADTSAEWVSIHNTDVAEWSFSDSNGVLSYASWRQVQSEFNADYPDDAAHWGKWYWSTGSDSSVTHQSGGHQTVRRNFIQNGKLPSTQDNKFRAINDDYPVFGFAQDLGSVDRTMNVLYTIVHAQSNAVTFLGAQGQVSVPSLWTSYFSSDAALVEFFYKDIGSISNAIDDKIQSDSIKAGGQNYATITTLSTRQALGAVQLAGTTTKPYLFLKEISSNGNSQTVDVLFPAIPIYLYLNPTLVKLVLDPLYENQESGHWPHTYAIHDLGTNYPRVVGHPDGNAEEMPVEECGNMIIATLAYYQKTQDTSYLQAHYNIMKQWTGYLIQDSLIPAHQLSTDDFQGPLENQTNLAIKGIIAIGAMGKIAETVGQQDDARNFTAIAKDYVGKWVDFAMTTEGGLPHTNLAYQDPKSHGLLYNIYADKLLNLNIVPAPIFQQQSDFYPTVAQKYGVPLDTRNMVTKSDWEIWAAAVANGPTKDFIIGKIATWLAETPTNRAFTDLYDTTNGDFPGNKFIARPVVGGHFALLAL
ncbi:hypothetical protein HYFRA_00013461 [Hymenoscyphus fraxineus]|uniref:Glutaminase GtaA n=1 Tax=Hymenoscyphus fraxineus TaxID=746836 RepID=A0A9N9L9X0_9HELO|nr:hypothetical protein HYFRA_00013461 [Hymenoscyphus fraxineus]